MLIAWSGHKPDVFREPWLAENGVRMVAAAKAASGVEFICGGQRGVDHWAARAAVARGLPFRLVLPLGPQRFTAEWPAADRRALADLIGAAASLEVIDADGALGPLAYDLRNEAIVRRAEALIVVWTRLHRGGTFETICAARMRGVPVEEVVLEGAGDQKSRARGL